MDKGYDLNSKRGGKEIEKYIISFCDGYIIPYATENIEVVKQYVYGEMENHRCDVEIKREDNIVVTYSKFKKGQALYISSVLIDFEGGEGYYTNWIV